MERGETTDRQESVGVAEFGRAISVGFLRRATQNGCVGEVFRRPAFRALFIGQAVSGFGDWMVTVALMALVLRLSGSSTAVGGVLLLRLLPAAAAAPFAARGVRGWDRRRTMQAADLVRAGIVIAIPLVAPPLVGVRLRVPARSGGHRVPSRP